MARKAPKPPTTHWVWNDYGTRVAFATNVFGLRDDIATQILRAERLKRVPRAVTILEITRGAVRDIVGLVTGRMCVSPVLRGVLAKADAEIQWIPVAIKRVRYAIPNALDVIPAIDLAKSKYRPFLSGLGIAKMEQLVPRTIPADAPEIFRPAEDTTMFVIGHALRQRLVAASTWPGQFTPIEDYRNEY